MKSFWIWKTDVDQIIWRINTLYSARAEELSSRVSKWSEATQRGAADTLKANKVPLDTVYDTEK